MCYAIEFGQYPDNSSLAPELPRYDFEDGATWGNVIMEDLLHGASGWIY